MRISIPSRASVLNPVELAVRFIDSLDQIQQLVQPSSLEMVLWPHPFEYVPRQVLHQAQRPRSGPSPGPTRLPRVSCASTGVTARIATSVLMTKRRSNILTSLNARVEVISVKESCQGIEMAC